MDRYTILFFTFITRTPLIRFCEDLCNLVDLKFKSEDCDTSIFSSFMRLFLWNGEFDMYIRVAQNAPFSVRHSMTGGKRKLKWRRVRKYICFLILFIPRSCNCKKPFRGFSEIYYTTFFMNLHNFPYFDPTKKSAIFFYNFQRHSLYFMRSIAT